MPLWPSLIKTVAALAAVALGLREAPPPLDTVELPEGCALSIQRAIHDARQDKIQNALRKGM